MNQTFPMNQESSLIGITINNTGKAVGRWWSRTSITFTVAEGWESLRKHFYLYCLLCTLIQALSKLKLLVFYIVISTSFIYFL